MNLCASVLIYAGGPGSGPSTPCPQCGPGKGSRFPSGDAKAPKVVSGRWNPDADLVYHWTDRESAERILDRQTWDGGSVTVNPAYRFNKSIDKHMVALVFERSKLKALQDAEKTVPWAEWEQRTEHEVNLLDYPEGPFLGWGVRTGKDREWLRKRVKNMFDEPDFFEINRVPAVTPKRLKK